MGKTAQGAVWLNEERLSNFDFYQFWRNVEDADVARFMRLYTDLSLEEIAGYERLEGAAINEAKKILALEATRMVRGDAAAAEAEEIARKTFEEGALSQALPTFNVNKAQVAIGELAVFAQLAAAKLVASNSEGRRLIKGGGARLNDKVVENDSRNLSLDDFDADGVAKLSAGKKRHALLKLV